MHVAEMMGWMRPLGARQVSPLHSIRYYPCNAATCNRVGSVSIFGIQPVRPHLRLSRYNMPRTPTPAAEAVARGARHEHETTMGRTRGEGRHGNSHGGRRRRRAD